MEKIKIYLDDVRTPIEPTWEVARNYDEFVELVTKVGLDGIEAISLDHDLGESAMVEYYNNVKDNYTLDYNNIDEKTGMDCCKFLVNLSIDTGIPLPTITVHSANPVGSHNMMGYITNYQMNCGLPQDCKRVQISFTISEELIMSPEARKARWKRSKK